MAEPNKNDKEKKQFNKNQSNPPKELKKDDNDSLKRLGEQLKNDRGEKENKLGGILKRVGIILLILILLGGIGIAIFFFTKNTGSVSSGGLIKLSVSVTENITDMSPEAPSIYTSKIYPGDKFAVKCVIRNSDNIHGDSDESGHDIFVRYSITLEVDGVKYNNVVVPVISDLVKEDWHVYNPAEEKESYVWDGFYYYYGSLISNQSLTLFDEIEFDFHNTKNSFGGKDAKITITVEAVQADINNIGIENNNAWNTAPRKWIENMSKYVK